jgi:hypothetical protein
MKKKREKKREIRLFILFIFLSPLTNVILFSLYSFFPNFQSKINVKNPVLTNKQTRVELYARVASYTVSSSQCNYGRMKPGTPRTDRSQVKDG